MSRKFLTIVIVCFTFFGFYAGEVWRLPGDLMVHVLDIGQGDSVLIQTPRGKHILIDGGPGVTVLERLEEEMGFWNNSFELVIITHPDLDHIEGLVEVFKRYRVDRVLMTGVVHGSALYRELLQTIEDRNIDVLLAYDRMDFEVEDGVFLDILYPFDLLAGQQTDNPNDTSIVTKLVFGQTSMLFSGDCEWDCEKAQLLTDVDIDADILTGGHHGSTTSFSLPYLTSVSPDFVVMSNGKDNQFGHPKPETLEKLNDLGIPFKNTSDHGTVSVMSDGVEWSW